MRALIATLFLCLLFCSSPAQARHLHHAGHHFKHHHRVHHDGDSRHRYVTRHARRYQAADVSRTDTDGRWGAGIDQLSPDSRRGQVRIRVASLGDGGGAQIVSHPVGCPGRAFCGCGVSVKIFGHPVRELYLARNWLRFPRAAPGAGMVAARSGHVMAIEEYLGNGLAKVYDPNSGRHQTRVHVRSLAGYRVVNPRSG